MIYRRLAVLAIFIVVCLPQQRVSAQADVRLFPETGWRVRGQLLTFWEASGALPVFGLPWGPAEQASTPEGHYLAQTFERERLELHPELAGPGAREGRVLLGRLGDELLRRQGRDWRNEPDGQALPGACRTFVETRRSVCGAFLDYWRSYGLELGDPGVSDREALALFGLPLTTPHMETNSSGDLVLTQWFERARFESHPAAGGGKAQVLLGRLGAELTGHTTVELPPLTLKLTAPMVQQGHTTRVEASVPDAVALRGVVGDVAVPFVRIGEIWQSFVGVPVLTRVGSLPLRVEADLPDGRTVAGQILLTVQDARYPREAIDLPKDVQDQINSHREAVLREREQVNAIWPQVTPERLWHGPFIMPAEGRISSHFGTLRSYNGGPYDSFHEGLDIANVVGTPLFAPARGRVVLAEPNFLVRGGAVILDHGLGVHTGFWHQSEILVHVGEIVEQGQLIGRMGAKGMVTGPHLHWDVRIGPTNVQPEEWIARDWP